MIKLARHKRFKLYAVVVFSVVIFSTASYQLFLKVVPPRNVIIITVDTLRADYLGTYGFKGNITPHIDSFAKKSAVFDFAIAPAPWTLPSISSMFTGLNVRSHGITFFSNLDPQYRYGSGELSDDATTLAELFQQAGFKTAAFSANPLISKSLGFNQGFDHFRDVTIHKSYSASTIFEDVTSWISKNRRNKFFMYLHYIDIHGPYRFGRRDFNSIYHDESLPDVEVPPGYRMPGSNRYVHIRPWMSPKQRHSANTLKAGYLAGVKSFDRKFGELINWLQKNGELSNSLIIFTSDHGEGFFEHGKQGHGNSMHQELIRIPLIVSHPDYIQSGKRVQSPVSLIDIKASLVAMYGLSSRLPGHQPDRHDGLDFSPLIYGNEAGKNFDRAIFSSGHMTHPACFSLTTKKSKVIVRCPTAPKHEERSAIYNLQSDFYEQSNLYNENSPETLEIAADAFSRFLQLPPPIRTEDSNKKGNSELIKKLRTLGYLAGSSPKRSNGANSD